MKAKTKNWIFPLIFIGSLLLAISSCKKDNKINSTAFQKKAVVSYATASTRPIHWWIGSRLDRATCPTANLVNSWTVVYGGNYKKSYEASGFRRQEGNVNSVSSAIRGIKTDYTAGARKLATDLENWTTSFTLSEAQSLVNSINARPGLTVLQWNSFYTWVPAAIPVIENNPRLLLMEMIYPTCEGLRTYQEIYDNIVWYLNDYSAGKKPGIGLSIYDGHDMTTPISWALMKTQIDAAKAVGLNVFGSSSHPIGIFIADVEPTEFTVDDVNNYIIYGTRTP